MFWQIVLEGFDNLNGEPVSVLIDTIARTAGLEFVALTEFEGSGDLEPIYRLQRDKFLRVEEFVPLLRRLNQIDWATLVLSETGLEKPRDDDFESRYARLLGDGTALVRFADGQYVYIFTSNDVLKDYVCGHFEVQALDQLAPDSFEWSG